MTGIAGEPRACALLIVIGSSILTGIVPAAIPVALADSGEMRDVRRRAKPELDPLGIRIGSFMTYPELAVGLGYDDNLFRDEEDRETSVVARIIPRFRLASDWNNHAFEISGSLDVGKSVAGEKEHFVDGALGATGRLDLRRATQLTGALLYEDLHEDRGSPELAGSGAFSSFRRTSATAGVVQGFGRLSVQGELRFVTLDFRDAEAADGTEWNNDDRDRDVMIVAARLGYDFSPGYEGFLRASYNERSYRGLRDDYGVERDSTGSETVVGLALDLTRLLGGEVYAGYRHQRYEEARLDDVAGLAFGVRLTASPTLLTTVRLSVDREIEDANLSDGSGYFDTTARIAVDHELRRNVILSGAAGYGRQDYRGIDREDGIIRVTLAVDYVVDRHLTIGLGYDFEERRSRGRDPGESYDSNRMFLRVTSKL